MIGKSICRKSVKNEHFFVPGSSSPLDCPAGKYCQIAGLDNYTAECQAGYYCTLGAWKRNPTDRTMGDRCPAGHYCPTGSESPTSCGTGTYSPSVGNTDISDCLNCTAGEYCGDNNMTVTSGRNGLLAHSVEL